MKVLCVLYDDPKGGMPKSYPLSDLPKLEKYPDGMTLPSPKGRDFTPVISGSIIILFFAIIINKFILKKNYPSKK